MAHQAEPDALLFYNNYNETELVKRDIIFKLIRSLLDQDSPIYGIGMQGRNNRPFLFDVHQQPEASFGRLADQAVSKL